MCFKISNLQTLPESTAFFLPYLKIDSLIFRGWLPVEVVLAWVVVVVAAEQVEHRVLLFRGVAGRQIDIRLAALPV